MAKGKYPIRIISLMKKHKSIKFIVGLLTSLLLLISAVEMMISVRGTKELAQYLHDTVDNQLPSIRLITLCDMMHDGLRAVVFNSIISSMAKNEEAKLEIKEELQEFSANFISYINELKKLKIDKSIVDEINKVEPDLNAYIEEANNIVNFALNNNEKMAIESLPKFSKSFDQLEESLGSLGDLVEKKSKEKMAESYAFEQTNSLVLNATFMIGLLLGLGAFFYISRKIKKSMSLVNTNISQNTSELSTIVNFLDNLNNDLSKSSQSQSASLQETASSLAEISSMMEKTREGGELLEKLSSQNTTLIKEGSQKVFDMDNAVKDIDSGNNELFGKLDITGNSIKTILSLIQEIQNKTKVINEIVFQTKLLSFNASVEAARAGEAGKGFAVVAEEVGNLANMSGKASEEISTIIQSSTKVVVEIINDVQNLIKESVGKSKIKISKGVESAKSCQYSFDKIQEANQSMSKELTNILLAISDQTTGIKEINTATQDIDHNTQELTTESNKITDVVEQLKKSVQDLNENSLLLKKFAGINPQHNPSEHHQELKDDIGETDLRNNFKKAA